MKVSDCKKCILCVEKTWSHSYQPSDYHRIGMTHRFAYCKRYKRRCSEVKKCDPKGF